MADLSYLHDVAQYNIARWWKRIRRVYPSLPETPPSFKLNNRLKTTAGRAWLNQYMIDLSVELFDEHTQYFADDTIPHELAHIAAFKVYGDPGHGIGWYTVLKSAGINTNRLHKMINTKHEYRRNGK